jgi:hypothetical protein
LVRIADHAASTSAEVSHGFPDRVAVDLCLPADSLGV